ncbi:hypothetical protein NP590_19655, partial [Methylomonas sp. SURF-2]
MQHTDSKAKKLPALALFGAAALAADQAGAESLDSQIRAMLAAGSNQLGCARLVGASPRDSDTLQPLNFGQQLAGLCGPIPSGNPPPLGGAPGGGAAAGSA